jgi:hypothetical protein
MIGPFVIAVKCVSRDNVMHVQISRLFLFLPAGLASVIVSLYRFVSLAIPVFTILYSSAFAVCIGWIVLAKYVIGAAYHIAVKMFILFRFVIPNFNGLPAIRTPYSCGAFSLRGGFVSSHALLRTEFVFFLVSSWFMKCFVAIQAHKLSLCLFALESPLTLTVAKYPLAGFESKVVNLYTFATAGTNCILHKFLAWVLFVSIAISWTPVFFGKFDFLSTSTSALHCNSKKETPAGWRFWSLGKTRIAFGGHEKTKSAFTGKFCLEWFDYTMFSHVHRLPRPGDPAGGMKGIFNGI